jgi:hypothetical protein
MMNGHRTIKDNFKIIRGLEYQSNLRVDVITGAVSIILKPNPLFLPHLL